MAAIAMTSVASSCASSEEGGVFPEDDAGQGDASLDSSTGGTGGFTGGTGGTSTGGTGGSATGGTGGTATGGTSGVGGTGGGTGGTGGGTGGTGGSSGSTGSCNPAFCPNTGSGAPCCVSPNGPCGSDNGLGCQQNPGPDV